MNLQNDLQRDTKRWGKNLIISEISVQNFFSKPQTTLAEIVDDFSLLPVQLGITGQPNINNEKKKKKEK